MTYFDIKEKNVDNLSISNNPALELLGAIAVGLFMALVTGLLMFR